MISLKPKASNSLFGFCTITLLRACFAAHVLLCTLRCSTSRAPRYSTKSCELTFICGFCAIALLFTSTIFALPSDNFKKLFISSDSASINRTTGISIYTGNVEITRGTTQVTADKLTTYSDKKDQIQKAIAVGTKDNLASYQTMTAENKPILIAKAITITYFPQKHYVILDGDASVIQGINTIKSPHLEYDLQKQILITNESPKEKNRTTIIIQPDDLSTGKSKD